MGVRERAREKVAEESRRTKRVKLNVFCLQVCFDILKLTNRTQNTSLINGVTGTEPPLYDSVHKERIILI